jgi:hypothetical protein
MSEKQTTQLTGNSSQELEVNYDKTETIQTSETEGKQL